MPLPRYKLVPGPIDVDVFGWELTGDRPSGEHIVECHETFHPQDHAADVEAALRWADRVIGSKQIWTHVSDRDRMEHWEAGTLADNTDGPEPTPADIRALIAEADALQERIRNVEHRLAGSEETRHSVFRLSDAAGRLTDVSEALEETAGELARVRAVRDGSVCAVPWGVCPEHGNTLVSTGGRTRCSQLACGRTWDYDRLGVPCGEPLTHKVTDAAGESFRACKAHAMDATERLIGGTVTPLNSTEA
ncbi:hypothetical protein [Streptomyces rubrogriseus]|uniref:Uncharacterized protein n=2 Tax=Streptomyces TaxID=1883 RepID=A0A6G3T6H1_9ACTN|nr:hypothetical protein [Streptomyces rubrogriseus]NEC32212.1 hypothetical protein [Streptomyces rubrogriseus]NEC40119.1 hypothetical protein [Streptomyces rubrogriseus]